MKKTLLILTSFFIVGTASCQVLDLVLMEKLKDISIAKVDDYMTKYYGYNKIDVNQTNNSITYGRYFDNDLDNSLVITIAFNQNKSNSLILKTGRNFDVSNLQDGLERRGFKKGAMKNFKYDTFFKNSETVLISIVPNENGMNTIKFLSNSK